MKSNCCLLLRYVQFELRYNLLRLRWAVLMLVVAMVSYLTISDFSNYLSFTPGQGVSLNVWDGVLFYWNNSNLFLVLLSSGFIVLLGDIIRQNEIEADVMMRLQSKQLWLHGKMLTILCASLVYVGLIALMSLVIAVRVFPWESDWSEVFF